MEDKNRISELMQTAMEEIRSMVDADTIIGDPIPCGDVIIIPVSKITFGLVSGGLDVKSKNSDGNFGGGGGAGVTVLPICFLAVKGGDVKILNINQSYGLTDKAIELAPELFEKIKSLFKTGKHSKID
ncbi:MAG: sporulation protein YtfJ [Oscillospiraceae bacterium]|nr:sporulation protein YtfJ [Candidatus Equicaccousia limihippi]